MHAKDPGILAVALFDFNIFGRNVIYKLVIKSQSVFPPQLTIASALPNKTQARKTHFFTQMLLSVLPYLTLISSALLTHIHSRCCTTLLNLVIIGA